MTHYAPARFGGPSSFPGVVMRAAVVTETVTVDEIDEALSLLAAGLATGGEDYRKVALTYADELLDRRLALPQK